MFHFGVCVRQVMRPEHETSINSQRAEEVMWFQRFVSSGAQMSQDIQHVFDSGIKKQALI